MLGRLGVLVGVIAVVGCGGSSGSSGPPDGAGDVGTVDASAGSDGAPPDAFGPDSEAPTDGPAGLDGSWPPTCATGVHQWTPCTEEGAQCVSWCNACSSQLTESYPLVYSCVDYASTGLVWMCDGQLDCYPMPGACGGVYIDVACTIPLSCPGCVGGSCASPSDCCAGTSCVAGRCLEPVLCHVDAEDCSDGIPCCGGANWCDATAGTCPASSKQSAGEPCQRQDECWTGTTCASSGHCCAAQGAHCEYPQQCCSGTCKLDMTCA
jgi:hypothetical protein